MTRHVRYDIDTIHTGRAVRQDGKPRNQWALWHARRARLDGKPDQELWYEQRADEPSYAEQRAIQAAKERDFARQWRAAGGDEAYAKTIDQRADELERPVVYPWSPGTSRALAEKVATLVWPDMPVEDAPDGALAGILAFTAEHKPQLVDQARAALLDGGFTERWAAKDAERSQKTAASVNKLVDQVNAERVDAEPDPFDPLNNGAGQWASTPAATPDNPLGEFAAPHATKRKRRR